MPDDALLSYRCIGVMILDAAYVRLIIKRLIEIKVSIIADHQATKGRIFISPP